MKTDLPRLLAGGLAALALAAAAPAYEYIRNFSTGLPVKWPGGTVNLRLMLGSTPTLADGTNYNTSAEGAGRIWNALLGSVSFQSTFAAAGSAIDHNLVNELAFASTVYGQGFGDQTLAITTTWRVGNERTEGDILFNSARIWDSYAGNTRNGVHDLHRVATHEMGHLLGLDHPDEAGQTVAAIMNSRISNLDTLTMDDITGAQNLYGPPGPAENDRFAAATVIGGLTAPGTVTLKGFNTLATKEAGEPDHADNGGGHSVWWRWTAPATGSVTLDTRGSYYDTTLGVYTGTGVAALTTVASNDDVNPGIVQASTLNFGATSGTVYHIGVDGFDADTGGITLNLTFAATTHILATITSQPASATVTAGGSVLFAVTATAGNSPITYQWQFNGTALSGAIGSSLTLTNVTTANAGTYTVVLTTGAGMVTSNPATLTVTPAPVVAPAPAAPASSGGGGGGAPSLWFLGALGLLALARWRIVAPTSSR